MYEKAEGIPQDYAQAMTWYLKAASNGNANAKKNIGNLYYYGKGVPQDYAKAMEWYESIKNTDIYLPE
ncbi:tetratricopeptide repeat protein [Enterobacter roggenkampii]|nr:sel1 repeat family protein [Enterobacter roggenkampii]